MQKSTAWGAKIESARYGDKISMGNKGSEWLEFQEQRWNWRERRRRTDEVATADSALA
jgi:hypothetical protein